MHVRVTDHICYPILFFFPLIGLDTLGGVGAESLKALQCPSLDLRGATWQRYAGHSNLGFLSNR